KKFKITGGKKIHLSDFNSGWHGMGKSMSKKEAEATAEDMKQKDLPRMAELQERLYASNHWSLLIVFQAMDAAGKDGTIRHVMTGVNPQGCQVFSFKQPSSEELNHDFLWRTTKSLPERGRIGIFNRSYYEEVLVVRVHPEYLIPQHIPNLVVNKDFWKDRYESIRNFEEHLSRNGTRVIKFFLNVSRQEQLERFLSRLDDPAKNWKFSAADLSERARWDDYMEAYEDAINHTASKEAPWYVVPADHKTIMRALVAKIIIRELEKMDLHFPTVTAEAMKKNAAAKKVLGAELKK
ncbi:MAG: polyphosphate kinase 2 family protein, partial [Candidatus Sumerlaeota bacterium]